jgi:hypothetical protein
MFLSGGLILHHMSRTLFIAWRHSPLPFALLSANVCYTKAEIIVGSSICPSPSRHCGSCLGYQRPRRVLAGGLAAAALFRHSSCELPYRYREVLLEHLAAK